MNTNRGKADVLLDMQRGDGGKGRFIDALVADYSAVARYCGGPNAGHTIVVEGQEIDLHQVPSGILQPNTLNVCGNGMVIDPIELHKEITSLQDAGVDISPGNLAVSATATVIMPHHVYRDQKREAGANKQGSTSRGIAYAYADKAARTGGYVGLLVDKPDVLVAMAKQGIQEYNPLRVTKSGDILDYDPDKVASAWARMLREHDIGSYITNTFNLLEAHLAAGRNILLEGAQGSLLDIETGMLPYVTSSDTGVAGAMKGTGTKHTDIGTVYGVAKVFPSHVGGGPFPSDIETIDGPETAEEIRGKRGDIDGEYGKTTERPRQVGYLDIPVLMMAKRFNAIDEILFSKLDVVERLRRFGSVIPIVVAYNSPEGGRLDTSPSSAAEIAACSPVIEYLPLWEKSVKDVRRRKDLPTEAQQFLQFVEDRLEIPITKVGVGYERDQLIAE